MRALLLAAVILFQSSAVLTKYATAKEAVTVTAEVADPALFFEPTEAIATENWQAIQAQQALYIKAKNVENYQEARRLALFHFVRAWLWNNEAYDYLYKADRILNAEELDRVSYLLSEARKDGEAAKLAGHHAGGKNGWRSALAMISSNESAVAERRKNLEKKKSK